MALLDLDTFAVVNAFEHFLGSESPDRIHALLDIGSKATNLNILRGSASLFSRSIPIGGTDFTQAISRKLSLEMDQAEVVKCKGERPAKELLSMVINPLENLFGEVKLSFDYFENQYDKRVERIYLSGGSSQLPGLSDLTQKSFNIESLSWDPLASISVSSEQTLSKLKGVREQLAVVVGLALRRAA